ncbi:phosphotransferase [Granulosicoccus antarcticus]|uniref:Aminoglycoside phosphotransferase domain-containing protein n=1 Tax=Granulosicoccus antarcticus IMCC3135 TaxID=1192854 RepID=A0A2Z2NKE8_9GAMM|nr:phosphotransferase [Granulosicoccus antarcticus]ASJ71649.1 hypothetical protein IMCC3135_07720 [Granulosicoccus antarcticus IMCC3135]
MILIGSAAYIDQDLAAEVGRLPPAFLPIGNRRLYEYQIELLSTLDHRVYLSIPESFELPVFDARRLEAMEVDIIRVPDGMTLGNSVVYCWSASGVAFPSLTVLHGDTLFLDFEPTQADSLSAHPNVGSYRRARVASSSCRKRRYESEFVEDGQPVLSGYFRFSNPQLLMQGILQNRGDFISGVSHYSVQQDMEEIGSGQWLDFGHLNSFFTSRSMMTTQRAFNALDIGPRTVTKSSENKAKMKAESNWFRSLPPKLRIHVPPLLSDYTESEKAASYSIEYLYLLPLSDVLVFGAMSRTSWQHIFDASHAILEELRAAANPRCCDLKDAEHLYLPKTIERLRAFEGAQLESLAGTLKFAKGSNLRSIASIASTYIAEVAEANTAIVHGDFCFSNLLFDSRTAGLKLIDPRGMDSKNQLCIYGDQRYDVAKMYHSVAGRYDFIIAGRYEINGEDITFPDETRVADLEKVFESVFFRPDRFDKTEILAINVLLFLSMIPLHADRPDRQVAMLLNAYRLYRKLLGTFQ